MTGAARFEGGGEVFSSMPGAALFVVGCFFDAATPAAPVFDVAFSEIIGGPLVVCPAPSQQQEASQPASEQFSAEGAPVVSALPFSQRGSVEPDVNGRRASTAVVQYTC